MKLFAGITFGLGILLIAGVAGTSDFYEECRAAADCVAGEAPSAFWQFIKGAAGVALMGLGVLATFAEEN